MAITLADLLPILAGWCGGWKQPALFSDRRFLKSFGISVFVHFLVIFVLGGAESTGHDAGKLYAARMTKPIQMSLSLSSPEPEAVHEQKVFERLDTPETVPQNQSNKTKPSDQPEASQGDKQMLVGPLSEMQYFRARELDIRPIALDIVGTEFPGLSRYPAGGWIVLILWINEFGLVDSVSIERSSFDKDLLNPVVEQYRGLKFAPAEKDGRKVRAQMKVLVEYPDSRTATPVMSQKK